MIDARKIIVDHLDALESKVKSQEETIQAMQAVLYSIRHLAAKFSRPNATLGDLNILVSACLEIQNEYGP